MKTCPVCRAGAFDDAEVCYGCLHRFSQGDVQAFVVPSVASAPNSSESGGAVGADEVCEGQGGARSGEPASMHVESVQQVVAADAGNVLSDCGSAVRSSLKTVDVPVRDADIVVRIELVDVGAAASQTPDSHKDAASASAPECVVLRRGRRPSVMDIARPAEVKRGTAAGQKGECVQEVRARHAAVDTVRQQRQAEIA